MTSPHSSCCLPSEDNNHDHGHEHSHGRRFDYIFWGSFVVVAISGVFGFLQGHQPASGAAGIFSHEVFMLLRSMWWGVLIGLISVGVLSRIPREFILHLLGKGGTVSGLVRATLAGICLDMCSHGILLVGMKLYERGASLGQTMAFLIASPWNSFSLLFVMFALIGLKWTMLFLFLSIVIALVSGFIFDLLVARGVLPANKNSSTMPENFAFFAEAKKQFAGASFSPGTFKVVAINTIKESRMVLRWLLFGIVLGALVKTFVATDMLQQYFGPTLLGLAFTMIAATLIEVCSEGATPIATDLLTRAGAPGNSFAFLMAGVSTDYTEIFTIKEITGSWKAALYLPLVTMPQIILLSYLLNQQ